MMTSPITPSVRLRSIALPTEHGGWSFLLEPVLLALLVVPSVAGFWLMLATALAFLAHQPVKLTIKDWRNHRRVARTRWAERFALLYGLSAGGAFLLAHLSSDTAFWLPLLLAAPLAIVQVIYDATSRSRELVPEITGALALGAVAPAAALIGGWSLIAALLLWLILALRTLTSILYVRARLRLEYGKPGQSGVAIGAHAAGIALLVGFAFDRLIPLLAPVAMIVLLLRAALGLSRYRKSAPAKVIGLREMGFGLLTVLLVAAGYTLNL
jgi:hypothetical protein